MIDEYINKHGKRLYGLCLSLCADKNEADDLYQETWLKVLKNIDKFDETKQFEPWLTKICVNIYRNSLKRLRRTPVFDNFRTAEEKERTLNLIKKEESKDYGELYCAIDNLPEKLRTAVVLFYFEDMNIGSASKILNIPEGTMKSRLNKARKLIKEALKNETDF